MFDVVIFPVIGTVPDGKVFVPVAVFSSHSTLEAAQKEHAELYRRGVTSSGIVARAA